MERCCPYLRLKEYRNRADIKGNARVRRAFPFAGTMKKEIP